MTLRRTRRSPRPTHSAPARAFTLVELLVVVSVIALLLGILLPTMGDALRRSRTVACAQFERSLAQGVLGWSAANADRIPGINTSGLELSNQRSEDAAAFASRSSTSPTQPFDWMSPAVGDDLPTQRAARLWQLMRDWACPASRVQTQVMYTAQADSGTEEALDYMAAGNDLPHATSYLMPVVWQYQGGLDNIEVGGLGEQRIVAHVFPPGYRQTASPPIGYSPVMGQVGEPALKIAFADGLRYFDNTTGRTNIDCRANPDQFGCFGSSGALFNAERAYGTRYDLPRKRNIAYTYRHGGAINAAFWDGHVATVPERESRDPKLWYPSGSILGSSGLEPDALSFGVNPGSRIP